MIENFKVKDIYGNMIEVVYDREDYTNYHLVMIKDNSTPFPITKGDLLSDLGYYLKPDTFIEPEFYSIFELRVFEYMARTNYELEWNVPYIDYVDFLRLLEEAEEIYYDKEGLPHFST